MASYNYKRARVIAVTGTIFINLCLGSCSGPQAPRAFSWEYEADISNEGLTLIKAAPDGLYGLSPKRKNIALKYEEGEFIEEYAAPEDVMLLDIIVNGPAGWLAGFRNNGGTFKPFLAKREKNVWREIPVKNIQITQFVKIVAGENGRLWLLGNVSGQTCLVLYDGADFRLFNETAGLADAAYSPVLRTVYGLHSPRKPREKPKLVMSADDGATWMKEEINFKYNGTEVSLRNFVVEGAGALYFVADTEIEDKDLTMIIKRTGAPGEGEYTLSYLSYLGPNFRDIYDVDFHRTGAGLAVGQDTTLVYEGGFWFQEQGVNFDLWDVTADPAGGYWGITISQLLRHP